MLTNINLRLPFDALNLILEYDGRIKYIHKEGTYVNIIPKNDNRYDLIRPKIDNKLYLINQFNIGNNGTPYYIDVYYKSDLGLILCKKIFEPFL